MSQKNANVNLIIARETRKDSTAMKTIAVLGMVFLPATFLAVGISALISPQTSTKLTKTGLQSFFAMPVFNWEENRLPDVKPGLGFYWIVTIPVTVLVMFSWVLAMVLPWESWRERLISKLWLKVKKDSEADIDGETLMPSPQGAVNVEGKTQSDVKIEEV